MNLTDDERAAIERLRRWDELAQRPYLGEDGEIARDIVLRDHPADEDEPSTVEFVRQVWGDAAFSSDSHDRLAFAFGDLTLDGEIIRTKLTKRDIVLIWELFGPTRGES